MVDDDDDDDDDDGDDDNDDDDHHHDGGVGDDDDGGGDDDDEGGTDGYMISPYLSSNQPTRKQDLPWDEHLCNFPDWLGGGGGGGGGVGWVVEREVASDTKIALAAMAVTWSDISSTYCYYNRRYAYGAT